MSDSENLYAIQVITAKRARLPPESPWVEANEDLVIEAKNFFERKFNLSKGNYQLLIAVISEPNQILAACGYNFTIFESHIQAFRAISERYKFGEGIYFPFTDQTKVAYPRGVVPS